MISQEEINEGNKKIAEFLGWFQNNDSIYLYYEKNELAVRVAYDLQISPFHDLPFHRDWNYMMKVVEKLENMGACVHSANYCKDQKVKDNLNAHIGFDLGNEDYYCDISGNVEENGTIRYFQIQRLDVERLESLWKTVMMFLDFYNDKTIGIINIENGKIVRKELMIKYKSKQL
jgi:hypothetical protein